MPRYRTWKTAVKLATFMTASTLILPTAFGQMALTTAQIAKKVSPSVVVIEGKTDSGDVLGSGFIVSRDGKIVTNFHVIQDVRAATVQLATGKTIDSISVLGTDEREDLAIIQVSGQDLPILEMGNPDSLNVGDPVVVVGSPRGLEGTVTAGILSSVRNIGDGFRVLQTDAAVNPGNSGGPLVNNTGQAVGVISFMLRSSQGLNFAIPINYVRDLLNNLHAPVKLGQMPHKINTPPIGPGSIRPPVVKPDEQPSLSTTFDWLKQNVPLLSAASYVASVSDDAVDISVHSEAVGWLDKGHCQLALVQLEYRRSRRNPRPMFRRPKVVFTFHSASVGFQ